MFRIPDNWDRCLVGCGAALVMLAPLEGALAKPHFTVLYTFTGGSDSGNPAAGVIIDKAGNLYGTTTGQNTDHGTVFKLAPDGTETVLYAFTGGSDGNLPAAGVIVDKEGNLYGTTETGGSAKYGVVFEVTPKGNESVLHTFTSGGDGEAPAASLIFDANGNLDGTTLSGGQGNCTNGHGCGTVFEVAPDGSSETVLYAFAGGSDGEIPAAGLIADKNGNLYGTTALGGTGCSPANCGTVFKLAPDGTKTVLYSFAGGNDGQIPEAGLVADSAGNLYGTTTEGGGTGCNDAGCGTVFKLAPNGQETVLYAFQGGTDGWFDGTGLVLDAKGNLYGTTAWGGGKGCKYEFGCGTLFKLSPSGEKTILHAFSGGRDGYGPNSLVADKKGNLYGTTFQGGEKGGCYSASGCGVVFKIAE